MSRAALFTLLAFFTFTNTSYSAEVLEGPIKGNVINVYDGDTLRVKMHVWLDHEVEAKVRINGIDTPEIKGKCPFEREKAQAAKEELMRLIDNNVIIISNIKYGKYAGRVLGDIVTADGINIAEHMISKGLARSYNGEKRKGWCE